MSDPLMQKTAESLASQAADLMLENEALKVRIAELEAELRLVEPSNRARETIKYLDSRIQETRAGTFPPASCSLANQNAMMEALVLLLDPEAGR